MPFDRKLTFEQYSNDTSNRFTYLFIHYRIRIARIATKKMEKFIFACFRSVHQPLSQLEKFHRDYTLQEERRRATDVGAAREYNGDFTAIMTHCRLLV